MRNTISAMMSIAVLVLALAGCGDMAKKNTNANADQVVNANVVVAKTNPDAIPSPRRRVTREEYDRDQDRYNRYIQRARESGRTIGSGRNDGWLWVKTKIELAAPDELRNSTINVDVVNEVVTLSGTVTNVVQKAQAEAIAKSIEGVKDVKNMLEVTAH